jgi:ATP-dependent helicase/nuclease subunit A
VKIDKNGINPYFVKNLKNNGDALLMTALMHKDAKELHKLILDNEIVIRPSDFSLSAEIIESVETDTEAIETSNEEYDENILNTISEKLRYKYDREELSTLSPKLVASSLDDIDKSFDYIASEKPSFASKAGLTPAERGTAMHEFMQYCDYSRAKVSIEDEVKRLVSDGSISAEQAASLNTEALYKFFTSAFAERMFSSDCIYKEIKTSSFVSASELYDTDYDDKVLIQGIADCVFEEKDGLVLIDYKTDKVESEEQLLDRYRNQIAFYKQSISKRFGKPVKLAALYSFYLGKICEYK